MIAFFDAYLPAGDKCGQQKPISGMHVTTFLLLELILLLKGWIVTSQICQDNGATNINANCNNDIFNAGSGIFTTPATGVYHCCASFRCKQGGYCDFTVIRNGGYVN